MLLPIGKWQTDLLLNICVTRRQRPVTQKISAHNSLRNFNISGI